MSHPMTVDLPFTMRCSRCHLEVGNERSLPPVLERCPSCGCQHFDTDGLDVDDDRTGSFRDVLRAAGWIGFVVIGLIILLVLGTLAARALGFPAL